MNPFLISVYVLIISIAFCFIAGLITKNYSHVDRLWSILPPVYVLIWMPELGNNPRFLIPAILIILWGIRLSINFAIKGGYAFSLKKGFYGEDYRWEILRNKIPNKTLFELFNLFFISGFQLTLIFFFTIPVYYLGKISGPVTGIEISLFSVHAVLLIIETIADIQQLNYYRKRGDKLFNNDKRVQLGFNTFGLWRLSRHPNYVCEISQWIVVSLYLYFLIGFHFSMLGSIALIFLFIGSTIMAESITGSKYPQYAQWKKVTPPWIPFPLFFKKQNELFKGL